MDRGEIIDFIKRHDSRYTETDFTQYTEEQLIIIKVRIEIEMTDQNEDSEE